MSETILRCDGSFSGCLLRLRTVHMGKALQSLGAGSTVSQVHARSDLHTIFRDSQTDLPGVDAFTAEQLSIPVGWWLSEQDRNKIIDTVVAYDRSFGPEVRDVSRPARESRQTVAQRGPWPTIRSRWARGPAI